MNEQNSDAGVIRVSTSIYKLSSVTMDDHEETRENKTGRSLVHNGVEERAVAALDNKETMTQTLRHGHKGILMMDEESKMETVTTVKAAYIPPKGPAVRLRGIRRELLEKQIAQIISDKVDAERNPPIPKTDFCSTTQNDFCVKGFVPLTPQKTQVHNYKTDQAVTFWSENYQRLQGVTGIQTLKAPFRRSAQFSKPINERLAETELPLDG